jgi:hypothetical protein
MAVSFNLPDPYEAQKADIARRQKYAEALQQQAFQPVEIQSYQGIQAPIPVAAGLAKALQGLMGGYFAGQARDEARELREGDIKKGQEFAAALQAAKTPEEREKLTLEALGGTMGQRAQGIAGPMLGLTETRAEAERRRAATAEQREADRALRESIALGQQENARLLAGVAAGSRADALEARREAEAGRREDRQRERERRERESVERREQLTAPEQRQLFQQEDQISAGQSTLSLLAEARRLSGQFRGGAGAGMMAYAGSQARSAVGVAPSEESNAIINYDNLVKEQALANLKTTFGGNPTEGERKVLLELQASSGKTPEQRADILDRAVKLAEDRIRGAEARAEAIRTRSYRQPGGQPAAPTPPAAPQRPAAPQAPGAAPGQQPAGAGAGLTPEEQRELEALRARFPRAQR